MRKFAFFLLLAPGAALTPSMAAAAVQDEVTVRGENRVVCRRVTRTATRMRVGRICRSLSEWRGREPGAPHDPNGEIDGAANTLDAMRADCIGTGDGKSPMDRTPDTPLGPR